ncbi:type II/IV secretion system protein [Methylocystis heyeri]|uniref:Type II/IV secretion system protein n=2 Tax=Methylocystis heyeri TaxID=391905 RepID=A0A6B8KLT4_9HYPH|nr:type II/IV secretion system protein [Methylocystis heyeri]
MVGDGVPPNCRLDPRNKEFSDNFGAFLLSRGAVDDLSLQRSQRAARQAGERFDQVLTKLGLIPEADLCGHLAQFLHIGVVEEKDFPPEPILPETVVERFIRGNGLIPLALDGERMTVALVDPFNLEPVDALAYSTGFGIELRLITPANMEKALLTLYGKSQNGVAIVDADARGEAASEFDLQRLRDIANEAPVIRRVNQIVAEAIEARASDIHIEPTLDQVLVRYRIDGVMRNVEQLPPGLKAAISSRIKIMAQLDIAERRLPQDGRIKLAVRGVDIDFRVSTIPTAHGESIVMRILDRSHVSLDFEALGFDADLLAPFREVMSNPNGILLVTGPTGSGKTTTLYTALKELNKPELKLFTVEDPIEYQLTGVNQVQVQPAIGMDFPMALRSILRQDPDIIMIGEIRDAETARIAIQSALTGHLVFSTLHTNGAAASITRLIDMGVESYLIASTVKGVLAQRLVRRLCEACAAPNATTEQWRQRLAGERFATSPPRLRGPVGCPKCRQTGYSGRSTIAELLVVNDRMHRLVCEKANDTALDEAARQAGMMSMYQNGMRKAWRGETSVEEVLRVTRAD